MPRVILGEQARREAALHDYICSKKGEGRQFKDGLEFAEKAMGVSSSSFYAWKRKGYPKFFEALCRMCQKTHITDRQLCHIFGVEYKGRTKERIETK